MDRDIDVLQRMLVGAQVSFVTDHGGPNPVLETRGTGSVFFYFERETGALRSVLPGHRLTKS